LLAKLAFGDEAQANEFYMPLIPNQIENVNIIQESNTINTDNSMQCDLLDVEKNIIENQINTKRIDLNENNTLTEEYKEKIII
jgi:hypothetical protein